jgi:hypothetical protein
MFRYMVVEAPRGDAETRDGILWDHGRSGWELVSVIEGSAKDPADRGTLTLFFKRSASEDIGV